MTKPASQAAGPIVIADAEPATRAPLAAALRQAGHEVLEAENGLEALLYVKRVRPVAVVVTLDLPRVNGLEVLRRIRLPAHDGPNGDAAALRLGEKFG